MLKTTRNLKKSINIQPPSKIKGMEGGSAFPAHTINSKSKFTILKALKEPPSLVSLENTITKGEYRKPNPARKSNIPVTSITKTMPTTKIQVKSNASINKRVGNRKNRLSPQESLKIESELNEMREISEKSIQTNESEILNHSLIVGDLKIVFPSISLTDEIDKVRRKNETKKLMMATRKFEEHSIQEEQHLDDLKEFLDKNYITRRPHRLRDNILEEDRKIIESMDELLQRERPKIESITDIKRRIKYKEQELLSLFDHFQKKTELFGKTKA